MSTENPERKPQKLVLWLLLAAVAGLFIVGGNVTGRASGEDQATGCGGRIDSENDQAQVEDELKFHRASTKSECGVNKTVLLSKSGQRRCVCNDGFVLKPSGACSNRWGKPIYTASLTQDNGGVKVKTPHARALSFGVPVPNRRVRNKKYAPRCRVKNALTKEFLPAQCQAMAFWPTKVGTFFTKWLKVTFVSKTFHSDQVPYVLYVYESTSPDKAKVKLANIVQNRGTKRLLINNGALQFQIERKGPIIQKARFSAPGTSKLPLETELKLLDSNGEEFVGRLDPAKPWVVEQNGHYAATIRLEGVYENEAGEPFNHFVIRLYIARNLDSFDIEHTLVVSSNKQQNHPADAPQQEAQSIAGLQIQFRPRVAKKVSPFDAITLPGGNRVPINRRQIQLGNLLARSLITDVDKAHSSVPSAVFSKELGESLGFVQLHSAGYDVGVALRKPRFEFPKALEFLSTQNSGDILSVDLWPAYRGNEDLMTQWPFQEGPHDLSNPYLDPGLTLGYNCVNVRPGYEHLTPHPSPLDEPQLCRQWTGRSEAEQQEIFEWIGQEGYEKRPLLMGHFTGDAAKFFRMCPRAVCNPDRRYILDNTASMYSTSQGMAKTHYLTVYAKANAKKAKSNKDFLGGGAAKNSVVNTIARLLDTEPYIRVDSKALRSSAVFGDYYLPEDNHPDFETIEQAMQYALDSGVQSDIDTEMFGLLRYGNELNGHGHSTFGNAIKDNFPDHDLGSSRGFFNQEAHDILYSAWWLYIRAGAEHKRTAWDYALKKCRNLIDLSTVWMHDEPHKIGLQGRHSMLPLSDPHTSHTITAGVQLCHLLTGNRRAREAVINGAEAAVLDYYPKDLPERPYGIFTKYHEHVPEKAHLFGGALRAHTAMWTDLLAAYELRQDQRYENIIHEFKDTLIAAMALENNAGALRGDITCKNGRFTNGGSFGSTQHSLPIGLTYYDRLFGNDPQGQEFNQILLGLANERLVGSRKLSMSDRAKHLALLARAYWQTRNPIYLSYYPLIKASIASETPRGASPQFSSGKSARYYYPRGIGSYLKAVRDYQLAQALDEQALEQELMGLYLERILVDAPADEDVEVGYVDRPMTLFVDEASDRYFEIAYRMRFRSKHSGGAALIKIIDNNDRVVYCREYCDVAETNADDERQPVARCRLGPQASCPAPSSEIVEVECDRTNRDDLFYSDGYRTQDECTLRFRPDDYFGRYRIIVDRLPDVGNLSVTPAVTENLMWSFSSNLASRSHSFIGGVGYELSSGPVNVRARKGKLYFSRSEDAPSTVRLETKNRQAGLYAGEVMNADSPGLSLYKAAFGWAAEPAIADLDLPAGDSRVPLWVSHGPEYGHANVRFLVVRLSHPPNTANQGVLWFNGLPYAEEIIVPNQNFEQVRPATPEGRFIDWTLSSAASVAEIVSDNPLEGENSLGLPQLASGLQHGPHEGLQSGAKYIVRALVRTQAAGCQWLFAGDLRYENGIQASRENRNLLLATVPESETPYVVQSKPRLIPSSACCPEAENRGGEAMIGEPLTLRGSYFRFRTQNQIGSCDVDALEVFRVE